MYLWLCRINNCNMTMVKQSQPCFSTVHTSNVSLHVHSSSLPADYCAGTRTGSSSRDRLSVSSCSTVGLILDHPNSVPISKLSVAAITQDRPCAAADHQPTVKIGIRILSTWAAPQVEPKRCLHNNKSTARYSSVARPT